MFAVPKIAQESTWPDQTLPVEKTNEASCDTNLRYEVPSLATLCVNADATLWRFVRMVEFRADSPYPFTAKKEMVQSTAKIVMTTTSSTSVKPVRLLHFLFILYSV